MAFAIVGRKIRCGKHEFGPFESHSEAVKIAQEAVQKAHALAKSQGLPSLSISEVAVEELQEIVSARALTIGTVIEVEQTVPEGEIIRCLDPFYQTLISELLRDPDNFHCIHWKKWEEIIAASYDRAGFDKVLLTPGSGDRGKDVIATKTGFYSVRFVDQVKAYSPSHLVTADEVRSLFGVYHLDQKASKAVLTTTGYFAPNVKEEFEDYLPTRLELVDKDRLINRLYASLIGEDNM